MEDVIPKLLDQGAATLLAVLVILRLDRTMTDLGKKIDLLVDEVRMRGADDRRRQ